MELITDEIFQLVKIKLEEQGAFDRDAYLALIEETIQYFRERGKLTDDDSDEFIIDELMQRWEEVEEEFAKKRF